MLTFAKAAGKNGDINDKWIRISHRLGAQVAVGAVQTIQWIGQLDVILRSLEEEFLQKDPDANLALTIQTYLSDAWVGSAYEIFRILKNRRPKDLDAKPIYDALLLLRVPLEENQLPQDRSPKDVLKLESHQWPQR